MKKIFEASGEKKTKAYVYIEYCDEFAFGERLVELPAFSLIDLHQNV